MEYGHPLYHGAWHQPPVEESSARHRSLHQERSETTQGINLATWHDPARYEANRIMDASKVHRDRLELERRELERRFEMPEQKYIPEHKFIPPTETDMRLENEMDFLFTTEKPDKCTQGPSEAIETTPDILGPHWESEPDESDIEWKNGPAKPSFMEETEIKQEPGIKDGKLGNANAIDPVNEAPRIEKWFRINPNAGKAMIDHYTFQLNELRKARHDKTKKENPQDATPYPKLESKDVTAWFMSRRNKSCPSANVDQIPYGSSKYIYVPKIIFFLAKGFRIIVVYMIQVYFSTL